MLKKLFVHEWKDSWKLVTGFNILVLVFTLIGVVALSNKNWVGAMEHNTWYGAVFVSYFMLFYFVIMALAVVTSFYFFMRFYKNFYTDQGYLMHTLPVTSHQLILSKAFVMYIWQTISGFVMCISIFVLINSFAVGLGERSFFEVIVELFSEIDFDITPTVVITCILLVLIMIGSQAFSIMFGYLAISLGQLSKNHKLLASIGIYFGMQTVLQMILSFAQVAYTMGVATIDFDKVSDGLAIAVLLLIALVLFAVSGGMYAGSNHIMKNKLNLE